MKGLNAYFMCDYFKISFPLLYGLRRGNTLDLPLAHLTRHVVNSLLIPDNPREIKESLSTEELKNRLKGHGALPCSCVVCRLFR